MIDNDDSKLHSVLEDEFKNISHTTLTFGRSSKQNMIAIPKAIFEWLPDENLSKALARLRKCERR